MYQKEWNRLEKGLLKGLNGHINQVKYIGALSEERPQIVCAEQVSSCVSHTKFNDADYPQGAVMNIYVYVSDENSVGVCEEKIETILEKLGYALTDSKPYSFSCDDGPIIMQVEFQRTIPMDRVTYALDEDDKQ